MKFPYTTIHICLHGSIVDSLLNRGAKIFFHLLYAINELNKIFARMCLDSVFK